MTDVYLLDESKKAPWGRVGVGSHVVFDINNDVNCKVGKVIAIASDLENPDDAYLKQFEIETSTGIEVRNLLYDIPYGKAKVVDPIVSDISINKEDK